MLDALQHRGPDSAGFAIYGGLGLKENEYLLNIEVKEKPGLLETVKNTVNMVTANKNRGNNSFGGRFYNISMQNCS